MLTRYEQAIDSWRGYEIQTVENMDKHLDSFRILFAYNSAKIENPEVTYHDTCEVFENGRVNSFAGDPCTLFEVQNQKTCYFFFCPK